MDLKTAFEALNGLKEKHKHLTVDKLTNSIRVKSRFARQLKVELYQAGKGHLRVFIIDQHNVRLAISDGGGQTFARIDSALALAKFVVAYAILCELRPQDKE